MIVVNFGLWTKYMRKYDLVVVGAGALGSFHAFHALKAGKKVALIEKQLTPTGATVRNFGQVVPSGMNSKWQILGRKSLRTYKELQEIFDLTVRQQGTVYIASNQAEVGLLEELHQINRENDYCSHLLTKKQCLVQYEGLRGDYCVAGLLFPQEVTVEPLEMIHRLRAYMIDHLGLNFFPNTQAIHTEELTRGVDIDCLNGGKFRADQVIICNGSDFRSLHPELFLESDLELVKLQMMQTVPQENYTVKGSILTGLSIRRYEAFQECPSYATVKQHEDPNGFARRYGIHILFKQAQDKSVIIGDSHQYAKVEDQDHLGFDLNMDIDRFILASAQKILGLPDYRIQRRWYGVYSQCKHRDIFQLQVSDHVQVVTGIGGKGMTGSAGFAEENIKKVFKIGNYA